MAGAKALWISQFERDLWTPDDISFMEEHGHLRWAWSYEGQ